MLLHLVASVLAFDGGAKYERWAHFKYVGIPHEAATDALATAAIADGACRLISPDFDGFALWRQPLKATMQKPDAVRYFSKSLWRMRPV